MIRLHHVLHSAQRLEPMARFYTEVLGLADFTEDRRRGLAASFVEEATAFYLGDANRLEVHLVDLQPFLTLPNGRPMTVNPAGRTGHVAYRTDDLDAIKARLDEHGVFYTEPGAWAIDGWHQIYCHDPMGNVIEVHQAGGGSALGPDAKEDTR